MIQYKFTELAKQLTHEREIDFTPTLADAGSSGYDLRACILAAKELVPGEVFKFPTGVHVWIGLSDPRYDEANDSYRNTPTGVGKTRKECNVSCCVG